MWYNIYGGNLDNFVIATVVHAKKLDYKENKLYGNSSNNA